jgi:XFP N-terminal domain
MRVKAHRHTSAGADPPEGCVLARRELSVAVGQIYLYDNPRLKRPLELSDVKPLIVGHWGTTPGQNCICIHLKPGDQEIRPGHVLCGRPWSRRAGTGG